MRKQITLKKGEICFRIKINSIKQGNGGEDIDEYPKEDF